MGIKKITQIALVGHGVYQPNDTERRLEVHLQYLLQMGCRGHV